MSEDSDTIVDFTLGVDRIGLANGLSASALSFSGSQVLLAGELLATLRGVSATDLSSSDFVAV